MNWLKLLRVHQWPKNAFVLAALIFGRKLQDPAALAHGLLAFAAFCVASSLVYLVNDLSDLEADREHPRKQHRPLASGAISTASARSAIAVALLLLALIGWQIQGIAVHLLLYLAINLFYSFKGKSMPLMDLLLVSSGFVIRVLAGAAAIEVPASSWIILCTGALAFFLASGKRRLDLEHSRAGAFYTVEFLDTILKVALTAALIFYGLYCNEHDSLYPDRPSFLWTFPPVIYGMLHYLRQIPEKANGGRDLLLDAPLLGSLLVWVIACLWLLA
jgi:4-hydroxybenzoate polyprenyltransferase